MTEHRVRPMLVLLTIIASCLPSPLTGPITLLWMYWPLGPSGYWPPLTFASIADVFRMGLRMLDPVVDLTLPLIVVMNLLLAAFTLPWLTRLYRALLFVLWGSSLIVISYWAEMHTMYAIPVVLLVATVVELLLVRNERLARKPVGSSGCSLE